MDQSHQPESRAITASSTRRSATGDPRWAAWQAALVEMVRLLGIYFTHARNVQGQRVTTALFDQIVRRAALLGQLPGYDGRLVIRRVVDGGGRTLPKTDYIFRMGSARFQIGASSEEGAGLQQDQCRVQFFTPLEHTLAFFEKLGVPGLVIRLSGPAAADKERLRLALEIVGNYPAAVANKSDLTFVLQGRPRVVALMRDARGRPDLGLTLLGGVNGLSAANACELVKRADALPAARPGSNASGDAGSRLDSYERIFTTPGLNVGLVRPLVEVVRDAEPDLNIGQPAAAGTMAAFAWRFDAAALPGAAPVGGQATAGFERSIHFLHSCLDARDEKGRAALERLVRTDCARMGLEDLFLWIDAIIRVRGLAGQDRRTHALVERLDDFALAGLKQAPPALWAQVALRGTSIRLGRHGHILMLGMVPEAVRQAVAVVRERVMCPRKLAYILSHTDPYQPLDPCTIASLFGVSRQEAGQVVKMAAACFHDPAGLGRRFHTDPILWNDACQNVLVQILWCHLRGATRPQAHLTLLGGLQLQVGRLRERGPFLNFLLTNLSMSSGDLAAADYDALMLCSLLLQHRESGTGVGLTEVSVLDKPNCPSAGLRRYVSWRLAVEQPFLTTKLGLLDEALRDGWAAVCSKNCESAAGLAFLIDLQREGLIFLGLAGGKTARRLIRQALRSMLDQPAVDLAVMSPHWRQAWLGQLNLVLRALGRVALPRDGVLPEAVATECRRRLYQFAAVEREAMIARVTRGIKKSNATNKAACCAHAAG